MDKIKKKLPILVPLIGLVIVGAIALALQFAGNISEENSEASLRSFHTFDFSSGDLIDVEEGKDRKLEVKYSGSGIDQNAVKLKLDYSKEIEIHGVKSMEPSIIATFDKLSNVVTLVRSKDIRSSDSARAYSIFEITLSGNNLGKTELVMGPVGYKDVPPVKTPEPEDPRQDNRITDVNESTRPIKASTLLEKHWANNWTTATLNVTRDGKFMAYSKRIGGGLRYEEKVVETDDRYIQERPAIFEETASVFGQDFDVLGNEKYTIVYTVNGGIESDYGDMGYQINNERYSPVGYMYGSDWNYPPARYMYGSDQDPRPFANNIRGDIIKVRVLEEGSGPTNPTPTPPGPNGTKGEISFDEGVLNFEPGETKKVDILYDGPYAPNFEIAFKISDDLEIIDFAPGDEMSIVYKSIEDQELHLGTLGESGENEGAQMVAMITLKASSQISTGKVGLVRTIANNGNQTWNVKTTSSPYSIGDVDITSIDFDGDSKVCSSDTFKFISYYKDSDKRGDLSGDGQIGIADFSEFIKLFQVSYVSADCR